ncbi:MAG: DUF5368 domain-containing protein [Pseudomonadota bacterium]
MKDLTLDMLLAVFEEIYGKGLFWGMVAAAVLVTAAFLYVVVRDHRLEARRLVRAELFAPIGALGAIAFVFFMTNSRLSDIGGPVDVIVLIGIAVAGGVGLTVLAYTAQALFGRRPV